MHRIELDPRHLATVRRIVRKHVPEVEVRAFGSRVSGGARKYSDLDLALVGPVEVEWSRMGRLAAAFSESDLPIRVDVLDWRGVAPPFRRAIAESSVVIQEAAAEA